MHIKTSTGLAAIVGAGIIVFAGSGSAHAEQTLMAPAIDRAITLDGDIADWDGIAGITVPLTGKGGVDSVELRAAVVGDMIYVLAVWDDSTEDILHKPFQWDEASESYKKTKQKEDRFAITFAMSGDFSPNKIDGSVYEADVWHWKASRTNPAGIAHDKRFKTSTEPFEKAKEFETADGTMIYVARISDEGDRLYKPLKYDAKQDDVMPRYEVNMNPQGSIADISAKGVWRDGRWYLEMARKLDTGHADDAVILASGGIEFAVAAFNNVDGKKHSISELLVLKTEGPAS